MLHNYEMIISESTHLDGAALDHVYLLKVFLHNKKIHCSVKNRYFSDHDAVRFKIECEYLPDDIDFEVNV